MTQPVPHTAPHRTTPHPTAHRTETFWRGSQSVGGHRVVGHVKKMINDYFSPKTAYVCAVVNWPRPGRRAFLALEKYALENMLTLFKSSGAFIFCLLALACFV